MTDPTTQQDVDPYARGAQPNPQDIIRMQQSMRANKIKNQIIAVLGNPDGMALIESLMEEFVHKPTWVPGAPEGYGYAREGENRIVLYFKAVVEKSQEPQVSA